MNKKLMIMIKKIIKEEIVKNNLIESWNSNEFQNMSLNQQENEIGNAIKKHNGRLNCVAHDRVDNRVQFYCIDTRGTDEVNVDALNYIKDVTSMNGKIDVYEDEPAIVL